MTKTIKLIALDMDGTLLNSNSEVTAHTEKVIAKAMEKGVHVLLSTGRWIQSCYAYAQELNLDSYIITCNGGEIWTKDKKLVERHVLETEKLEKMWNLGREIGVHIWMVSTDDVYFDARPDDFYEHEWLKFGCSSMDKRKLDKMIKELSYIEDLELTNSLPTNVEANPKGVSKAAALKTVCRKMGITMNEVMAVGDSLNDMKMIQEAAIGVAMGNAQQAIKNAANYVTDTNDNDGVAKAIEKFVL